MVSEADLDSILRMNEAEMIIMMCLCEQMVWHTPVQKVLVGQKVKIFSVQMSLTMVDGKLSFYYHHTKELGYPWFDSRVYHLLDVDYHLLADEPDHLCLRMNCG